MQERGADAQAVGDLAYTVVEHRVTRDPHHAVLLSLPREREPDHVADDRAAQRRAMATRCGGGVDRRAPPRPPPRAPPRPPAPGRPPPPPPLPAAGGAAGPPPRQRP